MFNENTWRVGESITQKYMKRNGFKIVFVNHLIAGVELDIVATLSARVQKIQLKKEFKNDYKNSKNKEQKLLLKKNYLINKKACEKLLIITEVKSRKSLKFGKGLEAISKEKQHHMRRGAEVLLRSSDFEGLQVRFDVASVDGNNLTYIPNAF